MELFKMKGIKTVPAQSAKFQPMAPFHPVLWQSAWISSNPLGIPTVSARKSHNRS